MEQRHGALGGRLNGLSQQPPHGSGHYGQGHDQAGHEGIGDGQHHIHKDFPGKALHKQDGHKHADRSQGGGNNGSGDLFGPGDGRLYYRNALAAQPVDIFYDHNGVIYQHTYAYGQTGHGDNIHGNAREVHEHQRKQHADGNADAHDQRGTDIP